MKTERSMNGTISPGTTGAEGETIAGPTLSRGRGAGDVMCDPTASTGGISRLISLNLFNSFSMV